MMIEFNDLSILSSNNRRAFNRKAKSQLKKLIIRQKPSLYFIYETHVAFSKVKKFWKS